MRSSLTLNSLYGLNIWTFGRKEGRYYSLLDERKFRENFRKIMDKWGIFIKITKRVVT